MSYLSTAETNQGFHLFPFFADWVSSLCHLGKPIPALFSHMIYFTTMITGDWLFGRVVHIHPINGKLGTIDLFSCEYGPLPVLRQRPLPNQRFKIDTNLWF